MENFESLPLPDVGPSTGTNRPSLTTEAYPSARNHVRRNIELTDADLDQALERSAEAGMGVSEYLNQILHRRKLPGEG